MMRNAFPVAPVYRSALLRIDMRTTAPVRTSRPAMNAQRLLETPRVQSADAVPAYCIISPILQDTRSDFMYYVIFANAFSAAI
ncbi:hypothetical protein DENSPDRAFT_20288 [Dentipellis sp. KUC8613]|nr:hypothetical protein DENSPDRAFT_20288 [Dentipellis sp. KUC8613]